MRKESLYILKSYVYLQNCRFRLYGLCVIFILFIFNCEASVVDDSSIVANKIQRFILLPAVVKTPETNVGFGLASSYFFKAKKNDTLIRTSNLEAVGLYTLNNQVLAEVGANVYFPKEKYILKSHNSYSHFPDKFWGIGNYTPSSNKERYIFEQVYFLPTLQRKVYKSFFVGLVYEFQNVFTVEYKPNGLFDQENIAGRHGSIVSGAGLLMAWDSRNNAFSSDKGSFIQLTYSRFTRLLGSKFVFSIYNLDVRKYIRTIRKQVLALQLYGNFTDGNPPIRNLSALGGANVMRGYYMGRYRDKDLVAVQAEYRIPLWKRIGMVVFGGLGEVSPNLKKLSLFGLKYSAGGGIRFALKQKEKLNLRLDYGIGYHSSAAYIIVTEAF